MRTHWLGMAVLPAAGVVMGAEKADAQKCRGQFRLVQRTLVARPVLIERHGRDTRAVYKQRFSVHHDREIGRRQPTLGGRIGDHLRCWCRVGGRGQRLG